MISVNVYEIVNQADKRSFTLYIEWFATHFKIMLLQSTSLPLSGEMNAKDIEYFCTELRDFAKSSDEYLQKTRKIFSENQKEIHYCIENKSFEWKRNVWTLGRIKLCLIVDIEVLSNSFQHFLKFYQTVQEKLNVLEKENKYLADTKIKLTADIQKMIEIKNSLEECLCKKFMLILNAKKNKLKELEDTIQKNKACGVSDFNLSTDEGEKSDEENHKKNNSSRTNIQTRKRKSIDNAKSEGIHKFGKTNQLNNSNKDSNISNEASTSTDISNNKIQVFENSINLKSENTCQKHICNPRTRLSKTALSLPEEESEEDLFSS